MDLIWQFILCGAVGAVASSLLVMLRGDNRRLRQKDIDTATKAAMEDLGVRKLILEIEALERDAADDAEVEDWYSNRRYDDLMAEREAIGNKLGVANTKLISIRTILGERFDGVIDNASVAMKIHQIVIAPTEEQVQKNIANLNPPEQTPHSEEKAMSLEEAAAGVAASLQTSTEGE